MIFYHMSIQFVGRYVVIFHTTKLQNSRMRIQPKVVLAIMNLKKKNNYMKKTKCNPHSLTREPKNVFFENAEQALNIYIYTRG